jgi:hypothetical protein
MTDQLLTLSKIDANGAFSKESLFNWVVDLEQQDFDDLCNQIISLYRFQQTYEGVLVSDEEDLLRPWLPVLPKIIFSVEQSGTNFCKKYFYQFLTDVDPEELRNICEEILSLYSHARENNNTYIISQVYPAVAGMVEFWRIKFKRQKLYSDLPKRIFNWQGMLLFKE